MFGLACPGTCRGWTIPQITYSGWPVQADLSLLTCSICHVQVDLSRLTCLGDLPNCPLRLTCPGGNCPGWKLFPADLSRLTCPCRPCPFWTFQADLFRLTCPADLSRLTCPGWPDQFVLFRISVYSCPLQFLSLLFCSLCPILQYQYYLNFLVQLSFHSCLVLAVLSWLSCPVCKYCYCVLIIRYYICILLSVVSMSRPVDVKFSCV